MSQLVDFLVIGFLGGLLTGWSTGLLGRVRGAALYQARGTDVVQAFKRAGRRVNEHQSRDH